MEQPRARPPRQPRFPQIQRIGHRRFLSFPEKIDAIFFTPRLSLRHLAERFNLIDWSYLSIDSAYEGRALRKSLSPRGLRRGLGALPVGFLR